MVAALRLTRAGDLVQATAVLQRALRGAACAGIPSDSNTDAAPTAAADAKLALNGQFLKRSFTGTAGTRTYKLFIPSGYRRQPCPLIVMLHGCTQTVDDFAAGTRMNELADKMACLVAYPEQPTSANSAKCWNWFRRADQKRDSGEPSLVAGITRAIMHDYAVDAKRVYIAGMSAGAAAAAQIAAAYPDVYAALGVHSGLPCGIAHDVPSAFAAMKTGERQGPLRQRPATPDRAMPTIVFHGDRDGTVHPRNGDRFADDVVAAHCDKQVRRGRISSGLEFTQTSYTNQSGQRLLEQWVVHGAGHAWSGGDASGSYTEPRGPDASREMLRFFLAHQHSE